MIVQKSKEMKSMSETSDMKYFVPQPEKGAEEILKEIKIYRNLYICTHVHTYLTYVSELLLYAVLKSPNSRRHSAFPFCEMFTNPINRIFSEPQKFVSPSAPKLGL